MEPLLAIWGIIKQYIYAKISEQTQRVAAQTKPTRKKKPLEILTCFRVCVCGRYSFALSKRSERAARSASCYSLWPHQTDFIGQPVLYACTLANSLFPLSGRNENACCRCFHCMLGLWLRRSGHGHTDGSSQSKRIRRREIGFFFGACYLRASVRVEWTFQTL